MRTAGAVSKGGRGLEFRLGIGATRATRDLDGVRVETVEETLARIAAAARDGWEGFTGTVRDRGPVNAPVPSAYQPHKLEIRLEYQGRSFDTVEVELSPEESGVLETVDLIESSDGVEMFTAVGLSVPDPVPTLSLAAQFAQKLHACTQPDTDDWKNPRAHDLVDLQLIWTEMSEDDHVSAARWSERVFRTRKGHVWPPEITARDGWRERYSSEAAAIGDRVLPTLEQAIHWARSRVGELRSLLQP